jgi:hypothetical protein
MFQQRRIDPVGTADIQDVDGVVGFLVPQFDQFLQHGLRGPWYLLPDALQLAKIRAWIGVIVDVIHRRFGVIDFIIAVII